MKTTLVVQMMVMVVSKSQCLTVVLKHLTSDFAITPVIVNIKMKFVKLTKKTLRDIVCQTNLFMKIILVPLMVEMAVLVVVITTTLKMIVLKSLCLIVDLKPWNLGSAMIHVIAINTQMRFVTLATLKTSGHSKAFVLLINQYMKVTLVPLMMEKMVVVF